MAPIIDVADAIQIVRRRPRRSPSLMQAKAPNAAPNVYKATTVPEGFSELLPYGQLDCAYLGLWS